MSLPSTSKLIAKAMRELSQASHDYDESCGEQQDFNRLYKVQKELQKLAQMLYPPKPKAQPKPKAPPREPKARANRLPPVQLPAGPAPLLLLPAPRLR